MVNEVSGRENVPPDTSLEMSSVLKINNKFGSDFISFDFQQVKPP